MPKEFSGGVDGVQLRRVWSVGTVKSAHASGGSVPSSRPKANHWC